ncbi:Exosome complex component CSL4 [Candida viswanathii]|uniref:Exosome complex component CSL4 n=1 Tax=Candida viswanathii TaxID=5486 RepID=A0A367XQM6_9ASCO|nr:Exosome complex component CSL4 [Candida viswanathii]
MSEAPKEPQVVVPGQYITPIYKLEDGATTQYIPGKGTIISNIEVPNDANGKVIPLIVSTILGTVHIKDLPIPDTDNVKDSDTKSHDSKIIKRVVTVVPRGSTTYVSEEGLGKEDQISINLPKENDVVLVRITKISNVQAYCELISLETRPILADSGIGAQGALTHVSLPSGGGAQHMFNVQTVASSQSTLPNFQIYDIGENFKGVIRMSDIRSTERDKLKIIDCFKPGDIVRAVIISLGDGSNYYLSTARNDLGVVFAKSENGAGGLMYPLDWQNMIDLETGLIEKRKNANPFI